MANKFLQEMIDAVVAGDTETAKELFNKYITESTRRLLGETSADKAAS